MSPVRAPVAPLPLLPCQASKGPRYRGSALPGVRLRGFPWSRPDLVESFRGLGVQLHRQAPRSDRSSSVVVAPTIVVDDGVAAGARPALRQPVSHPSPGTALRMLRAGRDAPRCVAGSIRRRCLPRRRLRARQRAGRHAAGCRGSGRCRGCVARESAPSRGAETDPADQQTGTAQLRVRHLLVHAVSISAVFSARDALLGQPTDTQGATSSPATSGSTWTMPRSMRRSADLAAAPA